MSVCSGLKEISGPGDLVEWDAYLEKRENILVNSGLGVPLAPSERRFLCYSEDVSLYGLIRLLFREHIVRIFVHFTDTTVDLENTVRSIIQQVFEETNIVRIQAEVAGVCVEDVQLYRGLGFQEEGILRENILIGDTYYDIIVLSLLREDPSARSIQCEQSV